MNKNIFIYRKGALGDTISFLPFLFSLKKKFKEIIFAGNYLYRQLFEGIDFIKFLDADSRDVLQFLTTKLSSINYDRILIFSNVDKLSMPFVEIFPPLPEKDWFYYYPFKVSNTDFVQNKIYLPLFYDRDIYEFLISDSRFFVFHPGSGGISKRWRIENFLLLEKFLLKNGYDVIYLLGEAELELKKKITNKKILVNSCLKKVIFLLSLAAGYVGCDSGISHLAGILNLKGVVVFGPSSPEIYRPWGDLKVLRSCDNNVNSVTVEEVIDFLGGRI